MNQTPMIGQRRPNEPDALRLLTVIHQLGEAVDQDGIHSSLVGESHLIHLEHLMRHPSTLIFVVIDHFARHPALAEQHNVVARRIRSLISNERQHRLSPRQLSGNLPLVGTSSTYDLPRKFEQPSWHRLDDVLALATCRDLLRLSLTGSQPRQTRYSLPEHAATWLDESVYPTHLVTALPLQLCAMIDEFLPLEERRQLPRRFAEIGSSIESFRREEQIPLEEDLLPQLFSKTFGERL